MRLAGPLAAAVVLLAGCTLAGAAPRRAAPARSHAAETGPDLFGGYSYTRAGDATLHGLGLSASFPLSGELRLVGDAGVHFGSFAGADLTQVSLMGGVRRCWRPHAGRGALSPFVEGLLGAVRMRTSAASLSASDTDWAVAAGGGADYRLSDSWSARGLVHARFIRGDGTTDVDPRLSIGVVYRLR